MAAPTLGIAPISSLASLPKASPNLMPFHVDHDGPAPISTYFLVEAAPEPAKPPPPAADEDAEMEPAVEATAIDAPSEVAESPPGISLMRRVTDATTRFVATFRGRTMQGLKVELPSGYSGVIMTGGAPGKVGALKTKIQHVAKAKARGSKTSRATRSTATHNDDGMDADDDSENGKISRTLMPTAHFSSLVLWHPDIPVDPGRDEYLRSLTEWIRLADEIHREE
ncbi:ribonuclease H2, subunit C [Mycena capillaripes]|nr:ribonuclease H2, subunit C [Mycena capillaripes]